MKYIILSAGLLFSLNSYAAFSDKPNDIPDSTKNTSVSAPSSDDETFTKFSKPICQSFCEQYHVGVQSCDIAVTGPQHGYAAPSDGHPAMAQGNSLTLNYNIVCATS